MLFEAHDTYEACSEFCAARKEELQTKVEFFPVAVSEQFLKSFLG